MAAAHDRERRFRWSEHAHLVRPRRSGGEPARKGFGCAAFPRRYEHTRKPRETSPFADKTAKRGAVWLEPRLEAEVSYAEVIAGSDSS